MHGVPFSLPGENMVFNWGFYKNVMEKGSKTITVFEASLLPSLIFLEGG